MLQADRYRNHPELLDKLQGTGTALLVSFGGRAVRVRGDGSLKLEDAVKQAVMREFGQTRKWADAHVNVEQLLARNLAIDMGSGIMFGKVMDAKGMQLFVNIAPNASRFVTTVSMYFNPKNYDFSENNSIINWSLLRSRCWAISDRMLLSVPIFRVLCLGMVK